jgi:hypothetical protein
MSKIDADVENYARSSTESSGTMRGNRLREQAANKPTADHAENADKDQAPARAFSAFSA